MSFKKKDDINLDKSITEIMRLPKTAVRMTKEGMNLREKESDLLKDQLKKFQEESKKPKPKDMPKKKRARSESDHEEDKQPKPQKKRQQKAAEKDDEQKIKEDAKAEKQKLKEEREKQKQIREEEKEAKRKEKERRAQLLEIIPKKTIKEITENFFLQKSKAKQSFPLEGDKFNEN